WRDRERDRLGRNGRLRGDPCRDVVGGQRAPLEDEHAARALLTVTELVEQLALDARLRAERTGTHREETLDRNRPSGILRGHAGFGRVIGPDDHARPDAAADRQRAEVDVPEPPEAKLRQHAPGTKTSRRLDAGINYSRAARKLVHLQAQFLRALDASICESPRALVHTEVRHRAHIIVSKL